MACAGFVKIAGSRKMPLRCTETAKSHAYQQTHILVCRVLPLPHALSRPFLLNYPVNKPPASHKGLELPTYAKMMHRDGPMATTTNKEAWDVLIALRSAQERHAQEAAQAAAAQAAAQAAAAANVNKRTDRASLISNLLWRRKSLDLGLAGPVGPTHTPDWSRQPADKLVSLSLSVVLEPAGASADYGGLTSMYKVRSQGFCCCDSVDDL